MHKVFVYALSTCPYCRAARKYLEENGVEYDVVEVDKLEGDEYRAAVEEVRRISGGTAFPVIVIDDDSVIVGFNKKRIKEELGL